MDDLISRQAAIDAIYKCSDIFAGDMPVMVVKADAYEALAQLPSAQPEPHWIPCSERLPDEGDRLILCLTECARRKTWFSDGRVYEGIYGSNGFMRVGDDRVCENGDVIAWMPLPEPYGGDQE